MYEQLNVIDEGAYGIVFRARDRATGEIVALKKFKGDHLKEGFPITALREINTLVKARKSGLVSRHLLPPSHADRAGPQAYHENLVYVREVVMSPKQAVFVVMEYLEHDVKALLETITQPFLQVRTTCEPWMGCGGLWASGRGGGGHT